MTRSNLTLEEIEQDMVEESASELVLKLSKPYTFEGETHTQIDLTAMEDVNGITLAKIGKMVAKKHKGINPVTLEMTMEYAVEMAIAVSGKPEEFFLHLPAKDCMALKAAVVGFLYGADGTD